jgi:hypothetical protein
VSQAERFRWNDEELRGAGFVDWAPFTHPQLGRVEIGGWKTRFTSQNPPAHLLKGEIEMYVPWMIWLAEVSPRIILREAAAVPAAAQGLVKVTVTVENEGYLATNITQRALDARIAPPVRAMIELRDAELVSGAPRTDLGHLRGSRDTQGDNRLAESRRTVEYVVRTTGARPVAVVTVVAEKGGTVKRELALTSR